MQELSVFPQVYIHWCAFCTKVTILIQVTLSGRKVTPFNLPTWKGCNIRIRSIHLELNSMHASWTEHLREIIESVVTPRDELQHGCVHWQKNSICQLRAMRGDEQLAFWHQTHLFFKVDIFCEQNFHFREEVLHNLFFIQNLYYFFFLQFWKNEKI